jgi:PHD/YefM family antitoxin component YafN of YafNO toxin-antitoxin module
MKTLTITEAKTGLNSLVSSKESCTISKQGKSVAVLLPYETFKRYYQAEEELRHQKLIEKAKIALNNPDKLLTQEELEKKIGL